MKERRFLLWRWCPNPERMKATRTRPSDRSWLPLAASALILSLLAIQAIQPWTPSAANVVYPNNYGALPTVEATDQAVAEAPQASQITSVVSTEHITVQLIFPDSADPGQAITVTATSTAKSSAKLNSLTIDVYSYVDKQLMKAASETVLKDKQVRSGDNWQTTLSVIVPQNAQRSAMIGTVTEIWEETSTYYSSDYSSNYYPNYYSNYHSAYCSNYYRSLYPDYDTTRNATRTTDTAETYPTTQTFPAITTPENYTTSLHNYLSQPRYVHQPRYEYEPSYVCEPAPYYDPKYGPYYGPRYGPYYAPSYTTQVSSEQTFPLTYILATTPEFIELQKTNDQLQKDYSDLVSKNNDLSSKYDSLKADYDQTVAKSNQLQSDYNFATTELNNYKTYTYMLAVVAVVAVALGVVVVFLLLQRRQAVQPPVKHETAIATPKKTSKQPD